MTFRIEHRIGVSAPPSEVWELIYDLEGWKTWTDLYSDAGGKIAIGEAVHFTFTLGERRPMSISGVVYDWVPEAQLAWNARLPGGIRTLRYLEIEKLSETSCILSNGDYYSGLGSWFMDRALRRDIRAAFQRMNENAKGVAEARWVEKGGTVETAQAAWEPAESLVIQPLGPTVKPGKPWGFGSSGGFGPRLNTP